jgi:hypothetical protein
MVAFGCSGSEPESEIRAQTRQSSAELQGELACGSPRPVAPAALPANLPQDIGSRMPKAVPLG